MDDRRETMERDSAEMILAALLRRDVSGWEPWEERCLGYPEDGMIGFRTEIGFGLYAEAWFDPDNALRPPKLRLSLGFELDMCVEMANPSISDLGLESEGDLTRLTLFYDDDERSLEDVAMDVLALPPNPPVTVGGREVPVTSDGTVRHLVWSPRPFISWNEDVLADLARMLLLHGRTNETHDDALRLMDRFGEPTDLASGIDIEIGYKLEARVNIRTPDFDLSLRGLATCGDGSVDVSGYEGDVSIPLGDDVLRRIGTHRDRPSSVNGIRGRSGLVRGTGDGTVNSDVNRPREGPRPRPGRR